MGIELTKEAAQELRRIMKERGLDERGTFLSVGMEGGERWKSYTLDLTNCMEPGDRQFLSRDITIVCAEQYLPELDDTHIDFRQEPGVGASFIVGQLNNDAFPKLRDISRMPTAAEVREVLRLVDDPEVGLNIVDLGLVYEVEVADRTARISMTLTTPACPLGDLITEDINERVVQAWPAVQSVDVDIVWDPPWSPDAISHEGKLQLGWSD